MTDIAVIGAGVAGFSAALAARAAGAEVLVLDAHGGGTALCGGAWDVATDPAASPDDVLRPPRSISQAIERVILRRPNHPYARLGADAVGTIERGHALVLGALELYAPLDMHGVGPLLATDLGLFRRAATAQKQLLDLERARGEQIAVGSLDGYRAIDGAFVARSLAELSAAARDDRRFSAIEVEFFRRKTDATLHPHEVALLLDAGDGRVRLGEALLRAVGGAGFSAALLPPVLGIEAGEVAVELATQTSLAVGEMLVSLAGPQSMRLVRAIDAALEKAGVTRRNERVARVELHDGGTRIELEGGDSVRPGAVVLATGKHIGGGLRVIDGRIREPLTSLPVFESRRELSLITTQDGFDPMFAFGDTPFSGGPLHRAGLGYDSAFRVLRSVDEPAARDLFVCGALLSDFDAARDGTGLGCCAVTGVLAGESAAAQAGR